MTLHKQAASLTILHAADVVQPLLILPYAGVVLGPAALGQYAYTLSLSQLAAVAVDYGFSLTARRAAAAVRNDPAAVSSLLAEIYAAKGILCIGVALVGFVGMIFSTAVSASVFLCIMVSALGSMLFPPWLFFGLERSWQATVAVVVARSIALVAFLTFVREPADAGIAAVIQASIPLMSAAVSFPFVLAIWLGGFPSLSFPRVAAQLRDGRSGFVSWLSHNAVLSLPVPLVQYIGGFEAAGQYSVAEKLISAVRPALMVMQQTFMPRVAYLASHDPGKGLALIWRSLWTILIGALLSLLLYFVGPYVILGIFGSEYSGAVTLTRALAVLPLIINIRICVADLYMFNYGHERAFALFTASGLGVFLATSFILSYWIDGAMSVALGAVAGEGFVALAAMSFFAISVPGKSDHAPLSGGADV